MKTNTIGYLILFLFSIIATILSIVIEAIYPIVGENRCGQNMIKTMIYRSAHYYISFYFALYLVFFRPVGVDSYIYLIIILFMSVQWCIVGCCALSYYELLNYDCDYRAYSTRFHPYIFSLLRNWTDVFMDIVGILIIWNIIVIMYSNRKIPWITKLLYIGTYSYSIYICCSGKNPIVDFLKGGAGTGMDGFEGKKVLAMKREIQRVDGLFLYPSEPDSFFMKYIAFGN